jgi:hypothetical protein
MTSYRQIEANRRNALRSTGPKTEAGKHVSRCNAVRHGLTAETVISAISRLIVSAAMKLPPAVSEAMGSRRFWLASEIQIEQQ